MSLINCPFCVSVLSSLQKNAIAVAHCKRAKSKDKGGVINVNGYPIDGLLPESMRYKVFEPILLVGNDKFKEVDIRVRVRGGGNVSQIFGEYLFRHLSVFPVVSLFCLKNHQKSNDGILFYQD